MALKQDRLSFDANLGSVRRWKQRFRAFHSSSNFQVLPMLDQQAFLIACIDDEVANRINRLVKDTMSLFPYQAGNLSCYDVIDSLFQEKIPVLLRRGTTNRKRAKMALPGGRNFGTWQTMRI